MSTNGLAARVEQVRKVFGREGRRGNVVAVDDVSFEVGEGESLGVVGESGSGKTTLARILVGLETPTSGIVEVAGLTRSRRMSGRSRREWARRVQMVFQDPYSSLDPRQRIGPGIDEILGTHFELGREERRRRIATLLDQVGLDERAGRALPRELSGGQRQRVAIARALAAKPDLLILDEAVAALDVSIQAQILNLIADLREKSGIAYLFVSHDLAVVRQVCDRAIVMEAGRVVETGDTATLLTAPESACTQRLVASVPRRGWDPSDVLGTASR